MGTPPSNPAEPMHNPRLECALALLYVSAPDHRDPQTWRRCTALLPHVLAATELVDDFNTPEAEIAAALFVDDG